MLTEDDVIDSLIRHLTANGWRIVSRARATEHGDDLVAERQGHRLVVEAKGAGSSKAGSARFGKEFNKGQVFDHVGKAVLKALRVASAGTAHAGIALPDNPSHRAEVAKVAVALS